MAKELGIAGKVALVCGGSRGIAYAAAEQLAREGCQVALCARDAEALARAADRLHGVSGAPVLAVQADLATTEGMSVPGAQVESFHGSFAIADHALRRLGWQADCVLADLGFASTQMDDPTRGFSFQSGGPLDMRLDPTQGETAADLVARLPEAELADAIFHLGEDPFARRIARLLVERRSHAPIATTADLAAAVVAAYGARARQSRMHPATRTFMALRILVNDELRALDHLLSSVERGARALMPADGAPASATWLRPGARIAIIAFHSLEDRRVKHAFADWECAGLGTRLTRKPVEADESEIRANPRARSAKLRAFQIAAESVAAR